MVEISKKTLILVVATFAVCFMMFFTKIGYVYTASGEVKEVRGYATKSNIEEAALDVVITDHVIRDDETYQVVDNEGVTLVGYDESFEVTNHQTYNLTEYQVESHLMREDEVVASEDGRIADESVTLPHSESDSYLLYDSENSASLSLNEIVIDGVTIPEASSFSVDSESGDIEVMCADSGRGSSISSEPTKFEFGPESVMTLGEDSITLDDYFVMLEETVEDEFADEDEDTDEDEFADKDDGSDGNDDILDTATEGTDADVDGSENSADVYPLDSDYDNDGTDTEPNSPDTEADGNTDGTDPDPIDPGIPIEPTDTDGDGLTDVEEGNIGTSPTDPDTDADGLIDKEDSYPLDSDYDNDGLIDGKDPNQSNPDTDGDQLLDGEEVAIGTDPKNPDTDGDILTDAEEGNVGTDPLDSDTDDDGSSDKADDNPLGYITGVTVDTNPSNITSVPAGTTVDFNEIVTGSGTFSNAVIWTVDGSQSLSNGTTIDENGVLTVAEDEMSSSLMVTAKSLEDQTQQGSRTINVDSTITGITIAGPSDVNAGSSGIYEANVSGTGNYDNSVTWAVTGNTSAGTTIDATTGILTVSADEIASSVTVTATSVQNTSIFNQMEVNVNPTITGVEVTGPNSVDAGSSGDYAVSVTGTGDYSTSVIWTVAGNQNLTNGTTIDENGVLAVASDEMAESLMITATSVQDPSMSGQKEVTVTPTISLVTIAGPSNVDTGSTVDYEGFVSGTGDFDTSVKWTVAGNTSAGTTIDENGVLSVASDEMTESLTITATSVQDPSISDQKQVTVSPTITGVVVEGPEVVDAGSTGEYVAEVTGTGDYNSSVTWTVAGNTSAGTTIDATTGMLTVADDENAQYVTVTATSLQDITIDGQMSILVNPTITGITVTGPDNVDVGSTVEYAAEVLGTGNYNKSVTWDVEGSQSTSNGTSINSNGVLTVASDEKAESLTILATSENNTSIVGEMEVTVNSTITGVTVTGPDNVELGSSGTYLADVSGLGKYDGSVTWTVAGNNSIGTTIDENGVLTVAADENATVVTVRATSKQEQTICGEKTVNVNSTITEVTVTGENTVGAGSSVNYTHEVKGTGVYDNSVTWTVTGNSSSETEIDSNGLLTVGKDENATSVTVTATSVQDPTKSESMTVEVIPVVTDVQIASNPAGITRVAGGVVVEYNATVLGYGDIEQNGVTWSIVSPATEDYISTSGQLHTDPNYEYNRNVTVKATSDMDPSKSASTTVYVASGQSNVTTFDLDNAGGAYKTYTGQGQSNADFDTTNSVQTDFDSDTQNIRFYYDSGYSNLGTYEEFANSGIYNLKYEDDPDLGWQIINDYGPNIWMCDEADGKDAGESWNYTYQEVPLVSNSDPGDCNDRMSSLYIEYLPPNCTITFYEHMDYQGTTWQYSTDETAVEEKTVQVPEEFEDIASSYTIEYKENDSVNHQIAP